MTNTKKSKIWNWILNAIIVGLIILGIYMILDRIFGNSPTDFELILMLFGLLGAVMIKGASMIYGLNREIGEFKTKSFHSFDRIKMDMKEIKDEIHVIKDNVNEIKVLVKGRKK